MARGRRISIAALNIAMHAPHAKERYVDLLRKAFASRQVVQSGSLHAVMLGSLGPFETTPQNTLVKGEIYRFVKLDPTQPWFNIEKKEPASDAEVDSIKIPAHLLPHLQRIPFIFNAQHHRLWYVSRDKGDSLSPQRATRFLETLLQSVAITHDFPAVSVTAIPDETSVGKILRLRGLEYLKIDLVRPNPDDAESAEARWLKKLEEQKAGRAKLELHHAPNKTLEPDDEVKEMASVAARNGYVFGRGRTPDGLPIEDSTRRKPMICHEFVDTDIETADAVLYRKANH